MANTHLSYAEYAAQFGDNGITEWVKYNWLNGSDVPPSGPTFKGEWKYTTYNSNYCSGGLTSSIKQYPAGTGYTQTTLEVVNVGYIDDSYGRREIVRLGATQAGGLRIGGVDSSGAMKWATFSSTTVNGITLELNENFDNAVKELLLKSKPGVDPNEAFNNLHNSLTVTHTPANAPRLMTRRLMVSKPPQVIVVVLDGQEYYIEQEDWQYLPQIMADNPTAYIKQ